MRRRPGSVAVAGLAFVAIDCGSNSMGPSGMMTGPSSVTGPTAATSVLSASPAGNSVDVATATSITIRFSEPMGSGMEQYVLLHEGGITGPTVPIARNWSSDRSTLVCSPFESLKGHTQYTVHLGGGMMDAAGHPIDLDNMPMMGGQWVTGGMMGGMPSSMMGPGWRGANGYYGMMLTFTTK